ncbi:hypothetical protein Tco_0830544 [Tanacetum coccineum]
MKFIQPFLKIVGYQGDTDKVSAFFTKFLAQPWQKMFKVFNRCLTSRTSGHDQTKINILQIFHAVVNRVNVDYAGLLWWGFLHCVQQKKDVIQYPRFTKLIIADLMKKFPSIPQRLEEDYHSIKDDNPWVSVYTMRNVIVRGMLILDEFLTDVIHATKEYKEYEKMFVRVYIPTIQPQPVESTQGANITPSTHRTPTPTAIVSDVVQKKRKRKQVDVETSSPKPSLKVCVKKMKPSTTPIPPPTDDRERDEIAEATLLSLTMHKTALVSEANENVAKVQEKLMEEDTKKMVDDAEEESYASEFADLVFQDDDDDSGNRIEPGSHKKNLEIIDDEEEYAEEKKDDKKDDDKKKDNEDNDNNDHTDHTLVGTQVTSSLEDKNEKMQTPIPSLPRSPRINLSSDITISQELKATVSPTPDTTSQGHSKTTFINTKVLSGSIAGMSRRREKIKKHLKTTFITNKYFQEKMREIPDLLKNLVSELTVAKTNEMIKEAVPRLVDLAVK